MNYWEKLVSRPVKKLGLANQMIKPIIPILLFVVGVTGLPRAASATALATATFTLTPTAANTKVAMPTNTQMVTATVSPTATKTNTVTPTPTKTNTLAPTATRTSTATPTAVNTNTSTPTAVKTNTPVPTITPTLTPTNEPTVEWTPTLPLEPTVDVNRAPIGAWAVLRARRSRHANVATSTPSSQRLASQTPSLFTNLATPTDSPTGLNTVPRDSQTASKMPSKDSQALLRTTPGARSASSESSTSQASMQQTIDSLPSDVADPQVEVANQSDSNVPIDWFYKSGLIALSGLLLLALGAGIIVTVIIVIRLVK